MIVTFVAASGRRPIGGAIAIYELANAFSLRGHDVHLVHRDLGGERVHDIGEIAWASFEPGVRHHFPAVFDVTALPDAEFVFYYDDDLPERCGLPLIFVQGTMIGRKAQEARMLAAPCPKVCVASWLVDLGRQIGVPEHQLLHVPYGLRHEKYRLLVPIEERPLQVSMLYNSHPLKGATFGLEALAMARRRVPSMRAVVFGTMDPAHPIPGWIEFRRSPRQDVLVEEIYNRSRVFLSPSLREGFGLPALEAMACGCGLVVTDNGGSAEYAMPGQTALVAPRKDAEALADHVITLLLDSERLAELAGRGHERALTFTWDRAAGRLESFLERYRAHPSRYHRQI